MSPMGTQKLLCQGILPWRAKLGEGAGERDSHTSSFHSGVPYSWGERSFCKAGRGCHPLSVLYRLISSFQPKSPCDLPIAMAIFTVLRMY